MKAVRKGLSRMRGYTWREVCAVLFVLGLTLQMLAPAIGHVRELSRRTTCVHNIHQVAAGLLTYHDSHGALPPASIWKADKDTDIADLLRTEGQQLKLIRQLRPIELVRSNWVMTTLPYMSQQPHADACDFNVPIVHANNRLARTRSLAVVKCPSDTWNRDTNLYEASSRNSSASFARGNYAINGGNQYIYDAPGWLANPRPNGVHFEADLNSQSFAFWGNGVSGINKSFGLKEFSNGTSSTVLVNEIRAGIDSLDPRGAWALGHIAASITWGHGINGDAYGPNNQIKDSDDIRGCRELYSKYGGRYLAKMKMPCCAHCDENNQAGSRSEHPGGVNLAMADGSVRFMADGVDVGLWHAIHSRVTPHDSLPDSQDDAHEPSRSDSVPSRKESSHNETSVTNSIGMKFVRVSPGTFTMGTPNDGNVAPFPVEAIPHKVTITRCFYLGTCEVTQEQFYSVLGNDAIRESGPAIPITNVTWHDATRFVAALSALPEESASGRSYRLPTEAEWEYAARAGSNSAIPFTSEWDDADTSGVIAGKAWKLEMPVEPVGSYPANAWGLHDMCGNVFEWTNDWFALDYYRVSPRMDPQGPATGYVKVVRGWYWVFTGPTCVVNVALAPHQKSPYIGFRIVCEHVK